MFTQTYASLTWSVPLNSTREEKQKRLNQEINKIVEWFRSGGLEITKFYENHYRYGTSIKYSLQAYAGEKIKIERLRGTPFKPKDRSTNSMLTVHS